MEITNTTNYKTKNEILEDLFNKYYETKDNELKDLIFIKIIKLVSGLKSNTTKINQISIEQRDYIINATYKYLYNNISALRGPLMNIYGEILNDNLDEVYIIPYFELIDLLLKKESLHKGL